MSDIVERLRQCDENFELAQEAADEIERLHAAFEKLPQASMTAYHERLRERNGELLDLLADAVDMLNIAMMEIHAWHASGSPSETERQRVTEIEATRNRIRDAIRRGSR
jgi:hypothetical protein